MVKYIVYDANGKITSAASGENVPLPTVDNINEFLLEGDFNIGEIHDMVVDGGTLRQKTQLEIDAENAPFAAIQFRQERDALLVSSDWTQMPDSPLTDAKKQEWATYRQALRDLPANTTDPANPTWPTQPS
jgi:hypothetical protein